MKRVFLFVAVALLSTSLFAQKTFKADKAHSKLAFTVTHLGISDVAGLFKDFDVTVSSSKADFSDAVFNLSADMASVNTEVEMRDNHLKSADFFDVANHPKMTFKSTSLKSDGKDRYKLAGILTLRGISKPVVMDLWYRGTITNPMSKAPTTGFQLKGIVKRSDFNIGEKFPAPMISDEVVIKADGEFVQ